MTPSLSEFKRLAKQGNLIPCYREFLADTETPVSAYLKVRDKSYSYLLESAEAGGRWGRYSLIGYKPFLRAASMGEKMVITEGNSKVVVEDRGNPLHVLRGLIKKHKPVSVEGLSPFQGGLVGYVNYDLIRKWEYLRGISPGLTGMPESLFTFSRRLIIFDHLTHRIQVVAFALVEEGGDLDGAYDLISQEINETIGELRDPLPSSPKNNACSVFDLESTLNRHEFENLVRKAKDHILAGDVIQVVLSQRFSGDVLGDDFTLYRNLRSINPSPYMFYLNFGETKLIGSSPEILARLTDKRIELRPIAGTRPRGKTPEEDLDLEEELMSDPKERAEHIMLVDLGRNDVGRVALPGSVSVPRLMDVERYSHVMHIVSSVEGQLKAELDQFDLFMAAFPAGTVSGAPKIRAMEIISELEPTLRGPYAGAVGYFGFDGNMDFCITIRTITITGSRLSIQVGAGIVADSIPGREYEETMRKAAALLKAIERMNES